ncbi:HpcH/HpaI aldolase/citrate lyase family protein [Streptomyces sp. bgisy060]|uniref:HpcH/HpaI aldolase/citrate lyase family protein n=1 Tax=Streptomyces sp. bgisy060 TaxID=3413775 RepID=UPI003EBD680A
MPVLESPELLYRESRVEALEASSGRSTSTATHVLALRVGVTDFCPSYGLRRGPDINAHDVQIVASMICRRGEHAWPGRRADFTVTGPVREYFRVQERMFKPLLRQSPFLEVRAAELRAKLIEHAMDGLLREVLLDGLLGKTCIPLLPRAAGARPVGRQPRGVLGHSGHPAPERGGGRRTRTR